MKKQGCKLYPFLQASAGNWRNAIFVECRRCPFGRSPLCEGFLIVADEDGSPIVLAAEQFFEYSGERVDKGECAAILDRNSFESAYALWLKWQIDTPDTCALLQLIR